MATVTLTGTWRSPALAARTGRVIATLDDPQRIGDGLVDGSTVAALTGGVLPAPGQPGALTVTGPTTGSLTYTIRERLDDVDEQRYRITVTPGDTVIDLSTRPT